MSTVIKKWYKLLSGRHIWHNAKGERVIAEAGDAVPLTDAQYEGLKPFFEPMEQPPAPPAPEPAPAAKPAPAKGSTK